MAEPLPESSPSGAPLPDPLPDETRDEARRLSLEEVLGAGAETLTTSIGGADRGGLNFDVLDKVVAATGTGIAGRPLEDGQAGDSDPVAHENEGGDGIGAVELEQLVAILETEADVPDLNDGLASKMEYASILLHEVHRIGYADPEAFGRRCEVALRGLPGARVTELLQVAVQDLALVLDHESYDIWMRALGPLLRRAVPFLAERLAEYAVHAEREDVRERLWPHAVDALLISLGSRGRALDPRMHAMSPEAMGRAQARLLDLQALGSGLLHPGTYRIDQESVRPLILMLMEGPCAAPFGVHLLAAFRESPPFDFGVRCCTLAHRRFTDQLGWVLTRQLESPRASVTGDAERSVAWVLTEGLINLDAQRIDETWIPDAILWLGQRDLSSDAMEQRIPLRRFLERVRGERRGLRRVWSKACRRAAAEALANPVFLTTEDGDRRPC